VINVPTEQDIREILERLARIEARMDTQPKYCKDHARRLERLEVQVGRQNFIAATLGAFAGGVVLLLKYLGGR
jgi:hypothetical protein